jgi:hypothetical protein
MTGAEKLDDIWLIGCKAYITGPTSYPSTWAAGTFPNELVYGLCMKGWINTIEIWRDQESWDDLFDADTELRADFNNFVL